MRKQQRSRLAGEQRCPKAAGIASTDLWYFWHGGLIRQAEFDRLIRQANTAPGAAAETGGTRSILLLLRHLLICCRFGVAARHFSPLPSRVRDPMNLCIRVLQDLDVDAALRLWQASFGAPRATAQSWIRAALDPRYRTSGLVAVEEGRVVGLAITEVGSRDYTRSYLGLDALGLQVPLDDRNGIFHLCVVAPAWRRQGIAAGLYERRLASLSASRVRRAVGISWNRAHAPDSRALFDAHGFERLATVERYYARTRPRHQCPDCGGFCICTASLHLHTSLPPPPRRGKSRRMP